MNDRFWVFITGFVLGGFCMTILASALTIYYMFDFV